MYLENQWYSLTLKNQKNKCTNSLDPSILSKYILKPLLNIVDERTDKNISFIEGAKVFVVEEKNNSIIENAQTMHSIIKI